MVPGNRRASLAATTMLLPAASSSLLSASQSPNSFVIIHLNVKHTPYGSIKFTFHPNISNFDCKKIIEKYKKSLKSLFLKCSPVASPPPGKSDFRHDQQQQQQQQHSSLQFFTKQSLHEQLKKIFLHGDEQAAAMLTSTSKANLRHLESNNDLLNFMHTNRYFWNISNEFVKDNLVDVLISKRLCEGFKAIFYTNKFIVFAMEMNILDSNVQHASQVHSQSNSIYTKPHKPLGNKLHSISPVLFCFHWLDMSYNTNQGNT